MLTVTPTATEAVNAIVSRAGMPESAGVRITSGGETEAPEPARAELRLAVVAAPESGDQVVEGSPVFLDEGTVGYLDDKVLDAEIAGDEVRFRLLNQPQAGV